MKSDTKTRLGYVSEFIRMIHQDTSPNSIFKSEGKWFSRRNEGWIAFSKEETQHYLQILDRLHNEFVKKEDLSLRSVEIMLQDAIYYSFDLNKSRGGTFEDRIPVALGVLYKQLNGNPSEFTCYVPVKGLAEEGLPTRFGLAKLVIFNEAQVRNLIPDKSSKIKILIDEMKKANHWQHHFAIVKVSARDSAAALDCARRETRLVIDTLNFFYDLFSYNYGWLYMPGESGEAKTVSIARENGNIIFPMQSVGPIHGFSIKKMRNANHLKRPLRVIDLLFKKRDNKLNELMLTAIQWAGRASVEPRREQKFLLYAIAIESIMLPCENSELAYRLSVRTANLLGNNAKMRQELRKEIKQLYNIRSQIVHNGSFEVTDAALEKFGRIVKSTILRLITHRAVRRLDNLNQLQDWFESKVHK
jgi:hypothetical protein